MQETTTIPALVDEVRKGRMPRRRMVQILTGMGISTAGIGAIIAAATHAIAARPAPTVDVQANADTHLQLHDQHIANQSQGNLDALAQDYADSAIVEDSMYPQPVVGKAAIIARKTLGLLATTDAQITVLNRIAIGNQVVVEWVATGVHTGDLPGMPASNRTYTLRGVTVVIRENGKIVREALYYDVEDLRRQITIS
jgi:steroid delta-isomerase-like uncharacterized protein